MSAALDAYELALRDRGNKARTIATTMHRLRGLTGDVGDESVTALTQTAAARRLYAAYRTGRAVDTHRNTLGQARTWGRWLVKMGWLRSNPWDGLEGVGRRKAGKTQLRIDEARAYLATGLELADEDWALAALLPLVLGLRAGEVADRVARDVDDGGRVLWIDSGKTAAARRALEVPAMLAPLLAARARGKLPLAPLLGGDRYWVSRSVGRLCRAAGVTVVTAHGLRGTHGSIAAQRGVTSGVVADALGHASAAVTERHYVKAESASAGATLRVVREIGETHAGRRR